MAAYTTVRKICRFASNKIHLSLFYLWSFYFDALRGSNVTRDGYDTLLASKRAENHGRITECRVPYLSHFSRDRIHHFLGVLFCYVHVRIFDALLLAMH